MENPDLVLDVLNFHDQYNKQLEQKIAKPMPGIVYNPTNQPSIYLVSSISK